MKMSEFLKLNKEQREKLNPPQKPVYDDYYEKMGELAETGHICRPPHSKRILKAVSLILICFLVGCASSHNQSYNHVSDPESDESVKGKTYDEGPTHPTGWETTFDRLGIK